MSVRVAVTAVGGGVGQSILKSLANTRYEVVGIDPSVKAAGLYMSDVAYLGKELGAEDFIERLIQICQVEDCKYLFPGLDAELPILSENKDKFKSKGINVIISSPDVIELSDSKWALYEFLKKNGFSYIPTVLALTDRGFPTDWCIVKPIRGCRSQGVVKLPDGVAVRDYLYGKNEEELLIQEYIDGPEYTCGTVSFDGDVLGVIAMTRVLRNGDTYKAEVDQNPQVLEFVTRLVGKIKPFGPCNVQLRLRNNIPYVLEINARCSGTTAARTLAGFNEPKMVLDYLEGRTVRHNIEPVEILRYWNEVVVRPEDRGRVQQ